MTLHCPTCTHPLYPHLARATDEGWAHVECPRSETCKHEGCIRPPRAVGYCHAHYKRMKLGRDMSGRVMLTPDHIEDIEWMAETGEHFDRAAQRLGVKPKSLERYLQRHKRGDLIAALRQREVAVA